MLTTRQVGTVFPSQYNPSTAFGFSFVTNDKRLVLDDFVTAESDDILYIGQVVEIKTINPDSNIGGEAYKLALKGVDDPELAATMDGGRGGEETTLDLVAVNIVYSKGVNGRSSTKRGPGIVPIRTSDEAEIREAFLGVNNKNKVTIPCGVLEAEGDYIPVYLDADYVLGKQSGHLGLFGRSGMASKTSYMTFLVNNIHQTFHFTKKAKVATIIFNVKDDDLLTLKESNGKETKLSKEETKMYEAMGMKPEFTGNVRNFSPASFSKITPDTFGSGGYDQTKVPTVRTGEGTLSGLKLKTEALFFGADDISNKKKDIISLRDFFYEGFRFDIAGNFAQIVNTVEKYFLLKMEGERIKPGSLGGMAGIIADIDLNLEVIAGERATPQNIQKMRSYLDRFTSYYGNIVDFSGQYQFDHQKLWDGLKSNDVWVIDIAEDVVSQHNKTVIIKYILNQVKKVLQEKHSRENELDYIIICLDEINRYIPADSDNEFKRDIIDIARAWRSKGGILFGAGQMMSEIDSQFISNIGTKIIGCSDVAETSHSYYRGFSQSARESLPRLEPAEKILQHWGWKSVTVTVKSPRPLNSIK